MFQLDENFLNEIGLGAMPEDQKQPFLQHIYGELELRVGTKLSEGMNEQQLSEFEAIIDRRDGVVDGWINSYAPNYAQDEVFQKLKTNTGKSNDNDADLKAEYAATKWLEINRPDYQDVVKSVLEELKTEISSNKDKILGIQQ